METGISSLVKRDHRGHLEIECWFARGCFLPYFLLAMAWKLRVQYEEAIYHMTVHVVVRRTIFEDDRDREQFTLRLSEPFRS